MTRATAALTALAVAFLVSCGRYGPPVRSQPQPAAASASEGSPETPGSDTAPGAPLEKAQEDEQ